MSQAADVDLSRESLIGFMANVGDKLVGLLVFVFFANYFSPGDFGAAYVVIGAATILKKAVDGVSVALRKRISEDITTRPAFTSVGLITLVVYAVTLLVVFLGLERVVAVPFAGFAGAGAVFVVGRSVNNMCKSVYAGVGFPGSSRVIDVVDGILTAGLRLALILGLNLGAIGLVLGPALSGLIVGVGFYLYRFEELLAAPTADQFRSVAAFARYSAPNTVIASGYREAGTVLLGVFGGGAAASVFKTAERLTLAARIPAREVSNAIAVYVSGQREAGEGLGISQWISITSVLSLPIFLGAVLLGDEIVVTVYGSPYAGTGYVLVWLSLVALLDSLQQGFIAVLNGSDRPDLVSRLQVLRAVVFIPAMVAGAWWQGIVGVLAAYVLTKPVEVAMMWHSAGGEVKEPLVAYRSLATQVIAGATMALAVYAVSQVVAVRSVVDLGILVGLGGTVYFVALLVLNRRVREEMGRYAGSIMN